MGDWLRGFKSKQQNYVARRDNTFVTRPVVISDSEAKNKASAFNNYINSLKNKELEKDLTVVKGILDEEKDAPKNLDKNKMAEMIVKAAYEAGVDPIIIAHIARRESDLNQYADNGTGKGLMQLTPISIEDMYQRPNIYEPELQPILKKYKTPAKLFEALKKDPELNLKLGAFLFKAKLNKANGNIQKALEYYNSSDSKYRYAKAVIKNINETKKSIGFQHVA